MVKINKHLYIFSDYGEVLLYDLCLACELKFRIGYPGLGMPVPLVIVYLISHLKFT